jgi:hypothetical protein
MSDLRLRAITEIHRAKKAGVAGDRARGIAPVPPVTEVVKPRTLFNAKDQIEFDQLTAGKYPAATPSPVSDDDGVAPAEVEEPASTATVEEPASTATVEEPASTDTESLGEMTKAQLIAYAKANEIEVNKKATVPEIRAAIEAAESTDVGEDEGDGEGGDETSDDNDLV